MSPASVLEILISKVGVLCVVMKLRCWLRPSRGSDGLKDKKSWWRVSPSCFGGGLCGGGRAKR